MCCGCSICCRECFMYCSIRRIMINVEDKLTKEVKEECDAINKEIEMEISRMSRNSILNQANNGSHHLPMPDVDLYMNMKSVRNLDLNAHKIDSNSTQLSSVSATPTKCNNPGQFVVDPTYFDDILEEKEEETEDERKKRISKKIRNITITSPDNTDIVVMKRLKKDGSRSPKSPKAIRKKYGLDLNFNRTTTLKRMQQEKDRIRSDEEMDSDAYDTDDDGNGSPVPGRKLSGNGSRPNSRPNSTKYADGSVAAILASIEHDEAEIQSENEDELGDLAQFGKNNSLKSRAKRMSVSLSTAL